MAYVCISYDGVRIEMFRSNKFWFILLAFTILFSTTIAQNVTKLQQACESITDRKSKYIWNSCLVWEKDKPGNTFDIAKAACTRFTYGHLLVVDSTAKTADMHSVCTEWAVPEESFYIGLKQKDKTLEPHGNWEWQMPNGKTRPANQIPWYTPNAEPNNGGNIEDCGEFYCFLERVNDQTCTGNLQSICQYEEPPKTQLELECRELATTKSTHYAENSCLVFETGPYTYDDAKKLCTEFPRGHLVTLRDSNEVTKLRTAMLEWQITDIVYIGLYQANKDDEPAGNWFWQLANDKVVQASFLSGAPDDHLNQEDCGSYVYNGDYLNDIDCSSAYPAVCEYDERPKTELQKSCEAFSLTTKTWYIWDSCLTVTEVGSDWDTGKASCTLLPNGHLVSLFSIYRRDQFDKIAYLWGVASQNLRPGLYQINKASEPAGNWVWQMQNNQLLKAEDITPWMSGEPNDSGGTEDCGTYIPQSNSFYDIACSATSYPICQYEEPIPALLKITTTTFETKCKALPNTKYGYGMCLEIKYTQLSWPDANNQCSSLPNGHLATIPTKNVKNLVEGLLLEQQAVAAMTIWIGLSQTNTTDEPAGNFEWQTTNGKRPLIKHLTWWSPGEPNNAGNENCVTWRNEFSPDVFNDENCNNLREHLCQYEGTNNYDFVQKYKDKKSDPYTMIVDAGTVPMGKCGALCGKNILCQSYSYNTKTKQCTLHSDDGRWLEFPPIEAAGYVMMVKI